MFTRATRLPMMRIVLRRHGGETGAGQCYSILCDVVQDVACDYGVVHPVAHLQPEHAIADDVGIDGAMPGAAVDPVADILNTIVVDAMIAGQHLQVDAVSLHHTVDIDQVVDNITGDFKSVAPPDEAVRNNGALSPRLVVVDADAPHFHRARPSAAS